jgi:integrase
VVYLGAAAMAILEAWWGEGDPDAPVFSAARSEASRNAARDRTLPRWPSHERAARRRAKARAGATFARAPGDRYTASSYRRAIERACDAAGVPRWTPYQLRHAGATEVCSRTTLEVARVILGHRSIETTERYYVHVARAQVAAAAVVAKNP